MAKKGNKPRTSKRVASIASKIMRDNRFSDAARTVAALVLRNRTPRAR